MSAKKAVFRKSMVPSALLAEVAMQSTPLARKLKANGFTPAVMAKEAEDLSALHTKLQVTKTAMMEASAALAARSEAFAQLWATYSNLVRAFTKDVALRRKHGVTSPGVRKGPMFRRVKRVNESEAESPAATLTTSEPNGSSGATSSANARG
jgi:hypothetical protein